MWGISPQECPWEDPVPEGLCRGGRLEQPQQGEVCEGPCGSGTSFCPLGPSSAIALAERWDRSACEPGGRIVRLARRQKRGRRSRKASERM